GSHLDQDYGRVDDHNRHRLVTLENSQFGALDVAPDDSRSRDARADLRRLDGIEAHVRAEVIEAIGRLGESPDGGSFCLAQTCPANTRGVCDPRCLAVSGARGPTRIRPARVPLSMPASLCSKRPIAGAL